jgi:hypothetical protein
VRWGICLSVVVVVAILRRFFSLVVVLTANGSE